MPVKDADILKHLLLKEEENETLRMTFEDDPMGFILKKYPGLNEVMEYMMTKDFKDYLNAIFIVAPKPTTFKVILHNGQYFFLQFMGKAYQATVLGKNYYLMSIGEKERCMLAIARLLRYGMPIKTKGPEGGEEGTRPEGEAGGGETGGAESGGEAGGEETAAAAPEAGGEEETPVTESMILENILKKSLFESKGIIYRKRGDEFSDGNTILKFEQSNKYPSSGGQYKDAKERDEEIEKLEKQFGKKIEFVNSPRKGLLAFGVAELKDAQGNSVYWGKYFESTNSMQWKNDDTPGGKFQLQTKTSIKSKIGIAPQDLIGTEQRFSSIQDVINHISGRINLADKTLQQELIDGLNEINNGKLPVFKGQANYLSAIQDYFGEIMAPLALMKGGLVGGQADEAEETLLQDSNEKYTWKSCEVSWVMKRTEKLIDSKLYPPNKTEIGISSKGRKGAPASARNLWPVVEKFDSAQKAQYPEAVQILQIINEKNQVNQIFDLAPIVGLQVSTALESEIKEYISKGKPNFSGISQAAQDLIDMGEKEGKTVKTGSPGFNAGRALLSILAKLVVKKINEDAKTIKFSEAVKFFMNKSTIVQVNCYMKATGNDAVVQDFKATYPPNVTGNVTLSADKNYTSSETKGVLSVVFPN